MSLPNKIENAPKPSKCSIRWRVGFSLNRRLNVTNLFLGQSSNLKHSNSGSGAAPDFYYNVGGMNFTIEEIKNGVLRSNKKSPSGGFKGWYSSDPRSQILQVKDPRVLILFKENNVLPDKLCAFNANDVDEVNLYFILLLNLSSTRFWIKCQRIS